MNFKWIKISSRNLSELQSYYKILGYKFNVSIILSLLVAILDGIGLSIFIPLLSSANTKNQNNPEANNSNLNDNNLFESLFNHLSIGELLITMLVFFSLKGLVKYVSEVLRTNMQQDYIASQRKNLIDLFISVKYIHYVRSDSGKLLNTLTSEMERLQQSFQYFLISLESACTILIYFLFALLVDPQFAILVTIGGVATNFIFKSIYLKTKTSSLNLSDQSDSYQGNILELLSNFTYLKSTNTVEKLLPRIYNSIEELKKIKKQLGRLTGFIVSVREPTLIFVIVTIIYIELYVLSGNLNGILISLLFFYRALASLGKMQNSWSIYLGASGAVTNISLLKKDLKGQQVKLPGRKKISEINNIHLKNISFSYNQDMILEDIDLKIERRDSIGIVGESGSGKTTMVNIISTLLHPTKGYILINNENIKDIEIKSYQKRIGFVTQDPTIFSDSVYNNVTLWSEKNNKNLNRFKDVIEKVKLTDMVNELPNKEDSKLERDGLNISGGQKQRISIARELFKNVDLLIFDEATSALDIETENWIRNSIDNLIGECILITIAHRLSTIKKMNKIILLKEGKIEDQGNFNDLVNRNKYFRELTTSKLSN